MALAYLQCTVKEQCRGKIKVDPRNEPWMKALEKENSNTFGYEHSTRISTSIIDTESSQRSQKKPDQSLLKISEDSAVEFRGDELHWNNKVRILALQDGLENHVPIILYLIRPETAYISCMHFIAKEIGGHRDYESQRSFIFHNPGIANLMEKFWKRVQDTHWSGGFAASISPHDRMKLLLGLIECYQHTNTNNGIVTRGPDSLPVPHIALEMLKGAGIHVPIINQEDVQPTNEAIEIIQKTLKRDNLPGIPNIISSYLRCNVCMTSFGSWKETTEHMEKSEECNEGVICTGCGLVFATGRDYNLHAVTFCKQGPLAQTKCPCCNTKGPKCLCQKHWQRTYGLVSSIYEGIYKDAEWLTRDSTTTGKLILASTVLDLSLADKEIEHITSVPTNLTQSLWESQNQHFPHLINNEEGAQITCEGNKRASIKKMETFIEDLMSISLRPKSPQICGHLTPKSTRTAEARKRIAIQKHFGTPRVLPEQATMQDITQLTTKVESIKLKLKDDNTTKMCTIAFDMTEHEIRHKLSEMEEQLSLAVNYQLENTKNYTGDNLKESPKEEGNTGNELHQEKKQRLEGDSDVEDENSDETGSEDEEHEKNTKKEKNQQKSLTGKFTCMNESHAEDSPPFKSFATSDAKLAHINKMHVCPMHIATPPCFFAAEMDDEMGKHIRIKHTKTKQKGACNLCNAPVGKESLTIHQQQIHSKCPNCGKYFENPASLKEHWSNKNELCNEIVEHTTQKHTFRVLPETSTLANLPDKVDGAEGLMTKLMGTMISRLPGTQDEKEKWKEMLEIANLHNKQRANISKNPYKAQSQTTPLLEIPNFIHSQKERAMDKILDRAPKTDLDPDTRARMENWILMENLNTKMTAYVTQYFLTEPSAVFALVNHLTDRVLTNIKAMYDRNAQNLSYQEIIMSLQKQYFNVDLRALREEVSRIRRTPNEKMQDFHGRVHALCTMASKNFEEADRKIWIEDQLRSIIYRGLDQNMRIEVDTLEATNETKMTSKEIIQTFVDRSNFRMNPIELSEDVIQNISKVTLKEGVRKKTRINLINSSSNKQSQKPTGRAKVNMVTTRSSIAPKITNRYQTSKAAGGITKYDQQRLKDTGTVPKTSNAWTKPSTSEPRNSPKSRLARPPSPFQGRPDTQNSYKKDGNRENVYKQSYNKRITGKLERTEEMMKKLGINSREITKYYCWKCGAGNTNLTNIPMHNKYECRLPFFRGEPHNCKQGVKLMHRAADCPYQTNRIGRIRREY